MCFLISPSKSRFKGFWSVVFLHFYDFQTASVSRNVPDCMFTLPIALSFIQMNDLSRFAGSFRLRLEIANYICNFFNSTFQLITEQPTDTWPFKSRESRDMHVGFRFSLVSLPNMLCTCVTQGIRDRIYWKHCTLFQPSFTRIIWQVHI